MVEFSIRTARAGDVEGIAALQQDVDADLRIPPDRYVPMWRWLCEQNPTGIQHSQVGVDASGKVVAHEAFVPFALRCGRRGLVGGLPCQLVVARDFRKGGLFPRLELEVLSKYPAMGIDFAYAPARDRVLNAHVALGFQALGELPLYARPFRASALARHYLQREWSRRLAGPLLRLGDGALRIPWHRASPAITVQSVQEFDEPLAAALNGVCGELGTHAERSAAALRWRFADAPGRHYQAFVARQADRPLGYVVTRAMPMAEFAALAVVDLVFSPQRPDVGASLLHAVHRAALEHNVDLAACMLNPHSPLLSVLHRFGYFRVPEGFTLIVHVPPQSSLRLDKEFFHHWHLTWFEHDYV